MPDDDRLAKYRAAMAEYEPPPADDLPHLATAEVVNCTLCDDDGYTASRRVCDHVDHTAAAKRGAAKVREVLAAKAKREAL